jgi:hypothetical protein
MVGVAIGVGVAAAATSAIGSVVGGSEAASGAKSAASTEAAASQAATAEQTAAREQEQTNVAPYLAYGTTAGNELTSELQSGQLGAAAPTDQNAIANMPGYQFTLQQGLLSTQNAQAAEGLGVSGSALKAAASYSTGLASTNYQNYFNDYWSNQNNRYTMLANTMNMGANAASNLNTNITSSSNTQATNTVNSAANQGAALTTAGTDTGNATSSAGNALGSGVSNALIANSLLGQTQGGSTLSSTNSTNALNAGGSPSNFQGAYGISSNQYVP